MTVRWGGLDVGGALLSHLVKTARGAVVGLWFLPACMVVSATVLGVALTALDPAIDEWITSVYPSFFGISAEGARGILSVVATSMLSVAALVFSITMVTLSLAANQYTSRILRTFTRDRGTQLVLGVFLGIFAYCLVVLRGIRVPTAQEPGFVPSLAVLLGIVFALAGLAFLVYFIQHISSMIQASEITARIATDTLVVIRREVREQKDCRADTEDRAAEAEAHVEAVAAHGMGYLRRIERERLVALAAAHDVVVHVPVLVGAFVTPQDELFELSGRQGSIDRSLFGDVRATVRLGTSGDIYEDPRFGIRQLVDVAVKALSPGINDPTTAVTCIDYLAVVLLEALPLRGGRVVYPRDAEPRVVMHTVGFVDLLDVAFDQLTPAARGEHAVLLRVLSTLSRLADSAREAEHRTSIRRQVERVLEASRDETKLAGDRLLIQAQADTVLERLGPPGRRDDEASLTA